MKKRIGLVVHGPQIVDSGYANVILDILSKYGEVTARLGGTMGRTAVVDAGLEDSIDISKKLLPSQSIDKLAENNDIIFLINYGKSSVTGHAFGYKVFSRCQSDPGLIQIERPGELDGTVIPWKNNLRDTAENIAKDLNLRVESAEKISNDMKGNGSIEISSDESNKIYRKIAGVSPDENILLNGIVVGKSFQLMSRL